MGPHYAVNLFGPEVGVTGEQSTFVARAVTGANKITVTKHDNGQFSALSMSFQNYCLQSDITSSHVGTLADFSSKH